jgi:hypothetical protein
MSVAEEQKKFSLPAKMRFAASLDRFLSKGNSLNIQDLSAGGNS